MLQIMAFGIQISNSKDYSYLAEAASVNFPTIYGPRRIFFELLNLASLKGLELFMNPLYSFV